MYLIIVYDIEKKRVNKVNKFLKRYLYWRQNSVFEGELSVSQYEKIKTKIKKLIDENTDSIYFYEFPNKKNVTIEIIGIEKNPDTNIL